MASSGTVCRDDLVDAHTKLIKYVRKGTAPRWIRIKVGKSKVLINTDFVAEPAATTTADSRAQAEAFVDTLDESMPAFGALKVAYEEDDGREVEAVVLIFWRASAGAKRIKLNMKYAAAVNTIKNQLTHTSWLEAENKGTDLSYEALVAKAKAKK